MKRILILAMACSLAICEQPTQSQPPQKTAEHLTEKEKMILYKLGMDAARAELVAKQKAEEVKAKFDELSAKCGASLVPDREGFLDCPGKK